MIGKEKEICIKKKFPRLQLDAKIVKCLYAALIVGLFYILLHIIIIPPLIHQETGLSLILAKVKYGEGLDNGDPWWGATKDLINIMPPLRTYFLYYINKLFINYNSMAFIMSTIYAAIGGCKKDCVNGHIMKGEYYGHERRRT